MQILPNLFFSYQKKKKKNVTSTLINCEKDKLKSSCFTVIAITFFFFWLRNFSKLLKTLAPRCVGNFSIPCLWSTKHKSHKKKINKENKDSKSCDRIGVLDMMRRYSKTRVHPNILKTITIVLALVAA